MNQPRKVKRSRSRRPKGSRHLSLDSASLAFAFILFGTNKERLESVTKLALRGPDLIKSLMAMFIMHLGENPDDLLQGEPTTPASKEELIALTKPVLEEGARLASFAQLFDFYLLHRQPSAENLVYVFYILARLGIAQEQEPSKEQSKAIWDLTLTLARTSKIGQEHWKELESRGAVYLEDWLTEVKQAARKKFKTFRDQKKRAEVTADRTFKSLFNFIFNDNESDARV